MRDLRIDDAPMFNRVMSNKEICKAFLEAVLGFDIGKLEYVDSEKMHEASIASKAVRMDVFAKGTGRMFDIEMQVAKEPSLGKRFRYYQGAMDATTLDKGDAYEDLPESYIIFICKEDPFGSKVPMRSYSMRCDSDLSTEDDLNVQMTWLVLSASNWERCDDPTLRSVLKYIHSGISDDTALVRQMANGVRCANEDANWRDSSMGFMTLEMHYGARISHARKEGLKEGLAEGEALGKAEERDRYSILIDALLDANRSSDLKRAANDPKYLDSLFEEFGL